MDYGFTVMNVLSNYSANFKELNFENNKATRLGFNPEFGSLERTFIMLKPDSFERNLAKPIENALNSQGLKVVKSWIGFAPKEKLVENYIQFKSKPFFDSWMNFLQSGKVEAMVVEGDGAVNKARALALKIREIFAPNEKRKNLLHSSDSLEAAKREIKNFFGDEFNLK